MRMSRGGRPQTSTSLERGKILKEKGLEQVRAVADVTTPKLPMNWPWGTLCGVEIISYVLKQLEKVTMGI